MDAVEAADLLIFTTPTYCLHASAPMKSFLDLTFTYWMPHRPRKCMFSKKAVVVSTAAGSGAKSAPKDITSALLLGRSLHKVIWNCCPGNELGYGKACQKRQNRKRHYKTCPKAFPKQKALCGNQNPFYVQDDGRNAGRRLGLFPYGKGILGE